MPPPSPSRRAFGHCLAVLALPALIGGCAALPGVEPPRVNIVGIEPLPGEGMEMRMAVKLRVQNPNEFALDYDGVSLELDVRGAAFASGVSAERGSVPRFGEAVITVPVSIAALSVVRQVIGLATGDRKRIDYVLRGRLGGTAAFGGTRFTSSGEIDLPLPAGAAP